MRMASGITRWNFICTILILWLAMTGAAAAKSTVPNPRERIDFWQKNYTAVTAETDVRVARAQEIFARVVRAAGHRPGVEPRLHVIAENPANISLPISIPDGWIIMSQGVLDFCYREPARGDDRLAFVLAHEVAHQLEDDFWHMKFFQALETLDSGMTNRRALAELRDITSQTNKVEAKELRADEQGAAIAAMAGFDPRSIVDEANGNNFFHEWTATLDPRRLQTPSAVRSHPPADQRALAVEARLRQIVEQTDLFRLGLMYYAAGDFVRAIQAFNEFRRYFPAREVNHDLATAYHQLALRHKQLPIRQNTPVFKLSVAIDPLTRATVRGLAAPNDSRAFSRNIAAAIKYYQLALAQDPGYLPVYRNLASAYIESGEPYKAVATLEDALKLASHDAAVLNNLGVAFYYTKNIAEAKSTLQRAERLDPDYDAPLFNLATLLSQTGNAAEARQYWQRYLARDATSNWAQLIRARYNLAAPAAARPAATSGVEALSDLKVGAYQSEVPKAWGVGKMKSFHLDAEIETLVAYYPNHLVTVSEGREIRLIEALPGYHGSSARGIRIGSGREEVLTRYGSPTQILNATTGESLLYPALGITFNVNRGRVVSWLLYWE